MPNFAMVIRNNNKRILEEHVRKEHEKEETKKQSETKRRGRPKTIIRKECTCQAATPCTLEGHCNVVDVIYEATTNAPETTDRYYVGQAKDFNVRYRNHQTSFRNKATHQVCNLKDEVWSLKDTGKEFTLTWKILRKSKSYKPGDKSCALCLDENIWLFVN